MEQLFVSGNNHFALELNERIAEKEEGNFFCSPFSLQLANAMIYAGAAGKTAESIARASCFCLQGQDLHNAFHGNRVRLDALSGKDVKLEISNNLWIQAEFPIMRFFQELIAIHYHAECMGLDFEGNPEQARLTINKKIQTETKDMIKEFFGPASLNPLTRLVLTQAIHFQGLWKSPFDENETSWDSFYLKNGDHIKVQMMRQKEMRVRFYAASGIQMVELPYGQSENGLHMLLLGRYDSSDLSGFERLTVQQLESLTSQMEVKDVSVCLPKFEIASEYNMKEVLYELGMGMAFQEDADWSGITEREGLILSDIIHKAVIQVDEKGTAAAVVTGACYEEKCVTPTFAARRPFMFFVRDAEGVILFMGRVENPLK